MASVRHDLGIAHEVKPEALGEPGQRTFRVVATAEGGSAVIWMEKEQLSALALSVQGYLREVGDPPGPGMAPALRPSSPRSFDFKATALALLYDSERGLFGVAAYDATDAESDTATLLWWLSRSQVERLADEALAVVSAGRPICPLCSRPMDATGHFCPHHNGHQVAEGHL